MSQEQPPRDILDMANEVAAQREQEHCDERIRYFKRLAEGTMKAKWPDETWTARASICLHITDPDDRYTTMSLWMVTVLRTEGEQTPYSDDQRTSVLPSVKSSEMRVLVNNLLFRDCNHQSCPGHLMQIVEGYLFEDE